MFKYYTSGSENDLYKTIRQFNLMDLLLWINKHSAALINNKSENELPAARRVTFQIQQVNKTYSSNCTVIETAWNLIELAYHAILYTNDYRGNPIEKDDELYCLLASLQSYIEQIENKTTQSYKDNHSDVLFYLYGFCGEQFKFELPGMVINNSTRELFILFESSKRTNKYIDIDKIIQEEAGCSWKEVMAFLFLGYTVSLTNSSIDESAKVYDWDKTGIRFEDFERVMDIYSASYDEIRKSPLGRQSLYQTPYIITSSNKRVSISPYLNLFAYEHSILWIVKNYLYKKNGDKSFPALFGLYFEAYFEELLDCYFDKNEYYKIPEENVKRADWYVNVCGYPMIIEQKSSLIPLGAKQQDTDIEAIKGFASKNIVKALEQLERTEKELYTQKCIKVVLLYEDYLKTEALDSIFELDSCNVNNDNNYWLVTINEIEKLFSLKQNNPSLLKSVIEEKTRREREHSKDGKSIDLILSNSGIKRNEYIHTVKFTKYINIVKNIFLGKNN